MKWKSNMIKYNVYLVDEKTLRQVWVGRHLEGTVTRFMLRHQVNGLMIVIERSDEPTTMI